MSARIRLKRLGSRKRPYYRIVVMDSREARDGRALEELGFYHPVEVDENQIMLKEERVREWLDKGATPSHTVRKLLNRKDFRIK